MSILLQEGDSLGLSYCREGDSVYPTTGREIASIQLQGGR